MGVFEIEGSSKGTFAIAQAVAEGDGVSIIGGGDSVKAINRSGYSDRVTFMSTGGGASSSFWKVNLFRVSLYWIKVNF